GAAGGAPARVAALAEGVIQAMWSHRVTKAALVLLLALLAGAAVVASVEKENPPAKKADDRKEGKPPEKKKLGKEDKELAKLQGTWVEQRSRRIWVIAGEKITEVSRVAWMIAEGKITEVDRGPQREGMARGTVTIDADKRPRTIDLTFQNRTLGKVHGVYEVAGNTLRACLTDERGPRPKELKDSGRGVLYTFRRLSLAGGASPALA